MSLITRYSRYTLVLVLCAWAVLTGCTKDEVLDESTLPITYLQIKLGVEGDTRAVSHDSDTQGDPYQHEGADNLLNVSDLDFIFYTTDGKYITMASSAPDVVIKSGPTYNASAQKHEYVVQIASRHIPTGTSRVVVLANRRDTYARPRLPFYSEYMTRDLPVKNPAGHSPSHTDEQYLYEHLTLAYHNTTDTEGVGIQQYTAWNLQGVPEGRIPMWGVQEMNTTPNANPDATSAGTIDLLRSIAKVKVSLAPALLNYVEVTPHQTGHPETGMVLNYKRTGGMMTPPYTDGLAKANTTPVMDDKDKVGDTYSNDNINAYGTASTEFCHVPMYYDADEAAYYMYLPEQQINEANIGLQCQWKDTALNGLTQNYTLHFADYALAVTQHSDWEGKALTEEQLAPYKFPVMRNHYYIYTITRLNPLVVKFEVCDWVKYSTEIVFH